MRVFAQALDLVDDPRLIEAYRAHHRRVWPEVLQALERIGIRRMKIFLVGTRLFMYGEAEDSFDPATSYAAYASTPRAAEWDELMRAFQRRLAEAPTDAWWAPMECVFCLESQLEAEGGPGAAG